MGGIRPHCSRSEYTSRAQPVTRRKLASVAARLIAKVVPCGSLRSDRGFADVASVKKIHWCRAHQIFPTLQERPAILFQRSERRRFFSETATLDASLHASVQMAHDPRGRSSTSYVQKAPKLQITLTFLIYSFILDIVYI